MKREIIDAPSVSLESYYFTDFPEIFLSGYYYLLYIKVFTAMKHFAFRKIRATV